MKHIFYFMAFVFLIQDLLWVLSPIEKTRAARKLDELHKQNKGKSWEQYSPEYKKRLRGKWPLLISMTFVFLGLLSFQWPLFIAWWVFSLLIVYPLSNLTKYSVAYTVVHWIASLIGIVWVVFILINAYHLHIDIWDYVKSLLI